jgi:hypothetical protein
MSNTIPLIQAIIVGTLALLGIVVTQSWTTRRDQAKRRIELAEEVLALFYEVKEAIQTIRSPGGWVGEGSTRRRGEQESEVESKIMDRAFVAVERYRKFEPLFSNMKSKKYRFMATFRGKAHESFDDIDTVIRRILVASDMLGSTYWMNQGRLPMTPGQFAAHLEGMREQEAVFWSMPGDTIMPMVAGAISKVEAITDQAAKEYAMPRDWWQRFKDVMNTKID